MQVFQQSLSTTSTRRSTRAYSGPLRSSSLQFLRNFAIRWFPKNNILGLTDPLSSSMHEPLTRATSPRQSASTIPQILASYTSMGPFLARLVTQSYLASPMFTVTLQRDTIDIGGNVGMLAIGELPVGVQNTSLTWALVTRYSPSAGGLTAPANSPDEVYPVT